jgi:plasmid stabilization system protein ParE
MTVLFAPEAEEDFAALVEYLAERNPAAAAELGRRIFSVIDKLAERRFDGPETVDRGAGGHHLSRRRASAPATMVATMVAAKSITAVHRFETGTAH